jgi:hypothetical protein
MTMVLVPMKTMVPIPQEDGATCWRAGYRMMFQWAQKDQAGIQNLLKWEIGEDAWNTCNQQGLLRKYWGNAVDAYNMYGHSGRDATSYSYVRDMIANQGPVLFHYTRTQGIHTIVLIGYDDDYENIQIIDPWWDPGTAKAASTYGISFGAVNIGIKGSSGWAGVLSHW